MRVAVTGAGSKVFRLPALEAALGDELLARRRRRRRWSIPASLRSGGEASPEYLAHLVSVMAKRAVQACR